MILDISNNLYCVRYSEFREWKCHFKAEKDVIVSDNEMTEDFHKMWIFFFFVWDFGIHFHEGFVSRASHLAWFNRPNVSFSFLNCFFLGTTAPVGLGLPPWNSPLFLEYNEYNIRKFSVFHISKNITQQSESLIKLTAVLYSVPSLNAFSEVPFYVLARVDYKFGHTGNIYEYIMLPCRYF
jgi:hypothetical protein